MMKTSQEKKTWRFTALDAILIVILLAVIGAAVWFFGPFRDGQAVKGNDVTIEYTIEIKGMQEDYLGNIQVGDSVTDSVSKLALGKVTAVESMPLVEYLLDTEKGIVEEKEMPGQYTMLVTISSPAVANERGFYIDGYRVAIGILNYLQFPLYVCSGYCIGVELVN